MNGKLTKFDMMIMAIIVLLVCISIIGLGSFNIINCYEVINQYGDTIKMWGSGVYKHDSYFKAPIFIGTDFTVLLVLVPMTTMALIKDIKNRTTKTKLILTSVIACILYYSASISFGITYNYLHLAYIALFSLSFFAMIVLIMKIDKKELKEKQTWDLPSKGIKIFLILSGLALFIAWLPDIIMSFFTGKSLALIEIYTTEITYVLDMGIVSPIMFICLYQLKNNIALGQVLLAIILKTCGFVGIMIIMQSLFQVMAKIEIPLPAVITKAGIFVILAAFSFYFNNKFYKNFQL